MSDSGRLDRKMGDNSPDSTMAPLDGTAPGPNPHGLFTPSGAVLSVVDGDRVTSAFQAERAGGSDQADSGRPGSTDEALESAFAAALDLESWTSGERMADLTARLEREVELAARHEAEMGPRIMAALAEGLATAPDRTRESGVYTLTPEVIAAACSNVLFNGNVEACDGTRITVHTLPVTVVQIGICLSSYQGNGLGGAITHRLYRQDITSRSFDPEAQVRDFIQRRARSNRAGGEFGDDGQLQTISDMLCRALMIYGERAMLARRSGRPWRMGHGSAFPYEILVGSGREDLTRASIPVLRQLLEDHRRFIFVPSEVSDQAVRTIANSLRPLQYAVLRDTRYIIGDYLRGGYERPHYKETGTYQELVALQEEVASRVVLCVYRASYFSPGGIFFAHEEHVHEAAQIVVADSALQEHRGFPNLIDVADRTCRGMFDGSGVQAQVRAVLARTGDPFRYLDERATRA